MKRFIWFIALLPGSAWAQDSTRTPMVQYTVPTVWRVDFLGLGPLVETRLGPKTTLNSGLHFVSQFEFVRRAGFGGQPDQTYSSFALSPVLHTAVRYFYNFERRLARNKSIRANSGNYLSLRARYLLPPLIRREDPQAPLGRISGPAFDALWGFQRTYQRNFYLNLSLGVGLFPTLSDPVSGAGDFTIGYTFPNRQ